MRISRSARLGGILAGVVAMSAAVVPPASAHSEATVEFRGTANVTTGLGIPSGVPTVTANPAAGKKTPPWTVTGPGANTRSGSFSSDVCVGTATNAPDKTGKPTTQGPACSIGATFTVTGYCGLSSGVGTGTATLGGQMIWYNFTWTDPGGGNLVILGNWWKTGPTKPPPGQIEGDVVAFVKATPVVTVPPTQSCTNKTQRDFDIVGTATLVHPKCSPPETLPDCALP